MPSMRCTTCGIDYPPAMSRCPVCQDETWYNKNGKPDELWEWEAESLRQRRMAGEEDGPYVGLQPYFLKVSMTEVIHVPETDEEPEDGGPSRAHLRAIPAISLVEVYAFRDQKLLLKPDDVVEIPNPDYKGTESKQRPTKLFEVEGTFRGSSTTLYMLRELTVPDTVPKEWVEEFYRGD